MGGFGTWGIASGHPGKFAAIVPICGGIRLLHGSQLPIITTWTILRTRTPPRPGNSARLPVWVFHGDADEAVPVTESRQMVDALKAAGGNVRYTEYPGVNHNSWDKAYGEPELCPWLLAQKLPSVK